jgi:hypothetical protein
MYGFLKQIERISVVYFTCESVSSKEKSSETRETTAAHHSNTPYGKRAAAATFQCRGPVSHHSTWPCRSWASKLANQLEPSCSSRTSFRRSFARSVLMSQSSRCGVISKVPRTLPCAVGGLSRKRRIGCRRRRVCLWQSRARLQ